MPRIFVSTCEINSSHAAALISRLREEEFAVAHSPLDLGGKMWGDVRIGGRCVSALENTSVFISVITESWKHSTWMLHETLEGINCLQAGKIQAMQFYNPANIEVTEVGMVIIQKEQLHEHLDELISLLKMMGN